MSNNAKRKLRLLAISSFGVYFIFSIVSGIALAELSLRLQKHLLSLDYIKQAQSRAQVLHSSLQEVSIQGNDGVVLRAWYIQPELANGNVAILLHGVADNRLGVAGYAEFLLKHDFSVLMPDMRDHGESGGEIASYGVRESHDIHHWVSWLYETHSPRCVYGLGESMGAAILLQSLEYENRFCAVAAESSFSDFREGAYDRVSGYLGTRPWVAQTVFRPTIEIGIIYARLKYGLDLSGASPQRAVHNSAVPMLLIHGADDVSIWPRNSEAIHRNNPSSELWIVPKAAHCGAWQANPAEFESRLLGWFGKKSV
jgi:pimeloyl-ACP methyl ester carboxylesterase